jgi:hypothetical protein
LSGTAIASRLQKASFSTERSTLFNVRAINSSLRFAGCKHQELPESK